MVVLNEKSIYKTVAAILTPYAVLRKATTVYETRVPWEVYRNLFDELHTQYPRNISLLLELCEKSPYIMII